MDGQPDVAFLIANLKHQLTLYRRLVDVLREERGHIVSCSVKELREDTYSKEALIDEIHREESRRQRWIGAFAKSFNVDAGSVTLESVAGTTGNEHFEPLMNMKAALIVLVKKTKDMCTESRRLALAALKDTAMMKKNILGMTSDKPAVYGRDGQMDSARDSNSRLLSKGV